MAELLEQGLAQSMDSVHVGKAVFYALLTTKCRESHLHTFFGNQTTNVRFLPVKGGGGAPKADNVCFFNRFFIGELPLFWLFIHFYVRSFSKREIMELNSIITFFVVKTLC